VRLGERERMNREETTLKQGKGRGREIEEKGQWTMEATEGGGEGGREEGTKGERGGKSVTFLRASSKRMSRVRVLHPFAKEEE
jgi:hypothetical protein